MTSRSRTDMTNDQTNSPWLTTEQAATYLSVSAGTMRNWRMNGQGPRYSVVGRIVRYHRDQLDAYLLAGAA
jgi:excisionase family DNA binding protein